MSFKIRTDLNKVDNKDKESLNKKAEYNKETAKLENIKLSEERLRNYIIPTSKDFVNIKSLVLERIMANIIINSAFKNTFDTLTEYYRYQVETLSDSEFCELLNSSLLWLTEVEVDSIISALSFVKDANNIPLTIEHIKNLDPYTIQALLVKTLLSFRNEIKVFFYTSLMI